MNEEDTTLIHHSQLSLHQACSLLRQRCLVHTATSTSVLDCCPALQTAFCLMTTPLNCF